MSQSQSLPQTLLTLLLPFSISLGLYLSFTYVITPLWQSQSSNLPLDTVGELATRVKTKFAGWMSKIRRNGDDNWDEEAGEDDEETGMLNYEGDRGRVWRGR